MSTPIIAQPIDTYTHGEILERTRILNVCERCLEILELRIDFLRRLLRLRNLKVARLSAHIPESLHILSGQQSGTCTHRLDLKRLDGLDVCAHVVGDRLELLQELLGLVNDGGVPQNRAVVSEVNSGGLRIELRVDALGIRVPLAEGLEGGDGLCSIVSTGCED